MLRQNGSVSPLETRRRLLIAESELNRTRMTADLVALGHQARTLASETMTLHSIVSSASVLAVGLAGLANQSSAPTRQRTPWWRILLNNTSLLSALWLTFRAKKTTSKNV